jgi:hypothetical protein
VARHRTCDRRDGRRGFWYKNERLHSACGNVPLAEYENTWLIGQGHTIIIPEAKIVVASNEPGAAHSVSPTISTRVDHRDARLRKPAGHHALDARPGARCSTAAASGPGSRRRPPRQAATRSYAPLKPAALSNTNGHAAAAPPAKPLSRACKQLIRRPRLKLPSRHVIRHAWDYISQNMTVVLVNVP